MQLTTIGNKFYFNLPSDFLPPNVEAKWLKFLHKNNVLYESVLDYLSSTIQDVVFPAVSFETPAQIKKYGKQIQWKDAMNIYDSIGKSVDVVFKNVDGNLNYIILWDALNSAKLDVDRQNDADMFMFIVDRYDDVVVQVTFRSVLLKGISDQKFSFGENVGDNKTFSLSFTYNYTDVFSPIDGTDLLTDDEVPQKERGDTPVPKEPNKQLGADVKPFFSFRNYESDEQPADEPV